MNTRIHRIVSKSRQNWGNVESKPHSIRGTISEYHISIKTASDTISHTCTTRRIILKAFVPLTRLAELELEESIIRENYMYGAGVIQAMIITERLNEICTERELIVGLLALEHRQESPDPNGAYSSDR